ncbi:hypothetical protein FNH22_25865 [Fulvivirga sp. M361]|uniref:hypothetical protein n=1 Tax=Fulvivirga sp. M361 TaxID=2594266 RepID=UPI00117BCEF5|nr:hypothetical protein [Fulvivirga sp. M361]TRX50203.1 hypothetical protein FNH22_25865 [Fulvivirga sp. M361]
MKFLTQIILIMVISALLQIYLPFWSTALVAFVISVLFQSKSGVSFMAGFLSISLLWFGMAYFIDVDTSSILTVKIAKLFSVSSLLLIILTALIGGLVGGFGALSGSQFVHLFRKKERNLYK